MNYGEYEIGIQKHNKAFFLRKLFQSTGLYIKGIVRVSASECAWQLELLNFVINKSDFKVSQYIILQTITS